MSLIDTHTHIFLEDFDGDLETVIERAQAAGVEKMCLPNIDLTTVERLHATTDRFPSLCFPMMGLHPTSVDENFNDALAAIRKLFNDRRYIAIGETGIDLYWDKTFCSQQLEAFETQLRWSLELDLPVVIHTRDAFPEVFACLERTDPDRLRGVFHCFGGSRDDLVNALSFKGFSIGINGTVTFKRSSLPEFLNLTPIDRLLLETDAPYLSPTPFRGQRNEPARLPLVLQKVAEIYGLPIETVAKITTENAKKLFGI
jgi:TatD DNase family protein